MSQSVLQQPPSTTLSDRVREFRIDHRDHTAPRWYSGWLHFWFTSIVSVGGIAVCLYFLDGVTWKEWLTVPITLAYANLAEYLGHRGPMHRKQPLLSMVYLHTTIHHRFFTHDSFGYSEPRDFHALLLPPSILLFFFGLFAAPVGVALYWFLSSNVALLFVASALFYFVSYEWMHFCYHAPPDSPVLRLPFMLALRQHHLTHHNPKLMTHYNFNITVPVFDWLFKTTYRPGSD